MPNIKGVFRELGLWVRYCFVWPGLPPRGNPADADVLLVQAFGRNQYPEAVLGSIAQLRQRNGTDTLTVEALHNYGFHPGTPNYDLAQECQSVMNRYPRVIALVQWEVATALDWYWYLRNANRIVCLWPPVVGYFSTVEVKEVSKQEMDRLGLSRPIELAHRRQIVRAFLIVRKLVGTSPIVLRQQTCSFDRFSVQRWTRSWCWWVIRETIVRAHHLITRQVW